MADIIEEILVKGKRPETFSGGLYNNAGGFGSGYTTGGTRGTRVGGLYGLAGPGSYANLARLGAEEDFRMKGVTDGPTLGEAEEALKAAADALKRHQAIKEFEGAYGQGSTQPNDQADQYFTRQAELQAELQKARNTYVALGGDPDPSFLSRLGQGAIDLIGAGGQKFSDIITGGTGPEVAQTLLDPIAILTGGFGGTINYSDSGKTTPLIVGNTTATGMPVGLNIPDPRAIAEEGFLPWLINNTGLGGPAAAAATGAIASNALDSTKSEDGVGLSGASLIAAAAALDKDNDAVKTITGAEDIIGGTVDPASSIIKTGTADIIGGTVDPASSIIKTGEGTPTIKTGESTPTIKTGESTPTIKTGPMSDADLDKILTDIGGQPAVEGGYDTPPIKTSSAEQVSSGDSGGGGGGGGGGLGETGGIRTVSGGPGPLVDIDYLYDFKDSLLQPFRVTDDEDEIEGRRVRRFNGTTGSEVLNPGVTAQDYFDATSGNQGNTGVRGKLSQFVSDNAGALLTSAVGGLFGLLDNDEQQPAGYQGAIPDYQFNRTLKENAFSAVNPDGSTRRPGSMGRSYFDYGAVPFTGTGVMQGVGIPAAVATDTGGIADLDTSALTSTGITPAATTPAVTTPAVTTPAVTTPAVTTPAVTAPAVTTPAVTAPAVTAPAVTAPAVTAPAVTAYDTFANSLRGRQLTAEDAAAIAASGYSLNDLASTLSTPTVPIDALALRNFINTYTNGSTTTDDGKVGTTGMGNLLVSLGGTRNADGTITDVTGTTYSIQDGAWRPVAATTGTTTTDTTDSNAAFNTFISPFYNSELTPAQLIALGNSGYDLSTIASALKVDATALSNAIAQATSAAQTQSIFDAIDPSDISRDDADSVANLILEGKTGIGNVAERFDNISDMDVIEGMLRGGYESPAAMTERLAPTNTGLTEVQLMASLLSQERTTPEELAAYYGNNPDYPEYAGITAADVRGLAKDLGIEGYAQGGDINGYYLGGTTDGMADQIPATIDKMQPAALSDGEFVIPADVVSHLGNGNSDAGAKNLYSMMDRVRTDRTGNPNQGRQINPNKYLA